MKLCSHFHLILDNVTSLECLRNAFSLLEMKKHRREHKEGMIPFGRSEFLQPAPQQGTLILPRSASSKTDLWSDSQHKVCVCVRGCVSVCVKDRQQDHILISIASFPSLSSVFTFKTVSNKRRLLLIKGLLCFSDEKL